MMRSSSTNTLDAKQKLRAKYERLRQEAVTTGKPTSIVLCHGWGETFIATIALTEEMKAESIKLYEEQQCLAWRTWEIDTAGGWADTLYAHEPDAFEMAWDLMEFYFEDRADRGFGRIDPIENVRV